MFHDLDSLRGMEARSLPEALKLIMRQRGCSQNRLSRDLRKSQSWISEVISGRRATEFAKVIKILDRVGWEVVIRPRRQYHLVKLCGSVLSTFPQFRLWTFWFSAIALSARSRRVYCHKSE